MSMRWTDSLNCQFVKKYVEYEVLWNTEHPCYTSRRERNEAVKKLAAFMEIDGFGVNEVKNKIRSLRATYLSMLNKIEMSTDSYAPTVEWFEHMKPAMEFSVRKNTEPSTSSNSSHSHQKSIVYPKTELYFNEDEDYFAASPDVVDAEIIPPKKQKKQPNIAQKECEMFCQYLALQLQQLPDPERLQIQNEIQMKVSEARIKYLQRENDDY